MFLLNMFTAVLCFFIEMLLYVQSDPIQVLKAETYQKCDIPTRLLPSSLPPPEKGKICCQLSKQMNFKPNLPATQKVTY